jgi:hypothetical protein
VNSTLVAARVKRLESADGCAFWTFPHALLRAFIGQYPEPTFWLEVPPALDDTFRYR